MNAWTDAPSPWQTRAIEEREEGPEMQSIAFALIARVPWLHGLVATITGCDDTPIPFRVS